MSANQGMFLQLFLMGYQVYLFQMATDWLCTHEEHMYR